MKSYSDNHIISKLISHNKRYKELTGEKSFFENLNSEQIGSIHYKIFYLNTISRIEVLEAFKKSFNEINYGSINYDLLEIELYTLREQIKNFEL